MGTQEIFMRAHEIAGEFNIVRGNYHTDDQGRRTTPERATGHCTVGIINRAALELHSTPHDVYAALQGIHDVLQLPEGEQITFWNDNIATDADVKRLFAGLAGVEYSEAVEIEGQEILSFA